MTILRQIFQSGFCNKFAPSLTESMVHGRLGQAQTSDDVIGDTLQRLSLPTSCGDIIDGIETLVKIELERTGRGRYARCVAGYGEVGC